MVLVDRREGSAKVHAGDGTVTDPHWETVDHADLLMWDSATEARSDSGYL